MSIYKTLNIVSNNLYGNVFRRFQSWVHMPLRIFGAIPALLSVVDERDERCQRNIPVILAILTELVILQ